MRGFAMRMLGSPGRSALLALIIASAVVGARIACHRTAMGRFDLILLLLPALVMDAAFVQQLVQRKWMRAWGSLALGMGFFFLVFAGIQWTWESTTGTLPNELGTIMLQRRDADPPEFLPAPGSVELWRVIIDTKHHRGFTIMLGVVVDHSANLKVWLIEKDGNKVLKLNLSGKDYYFDLVRGALTHSVSQAGKRLGTFIDGEFIPEYAEHPKANGGLFRPFAIAVGGDGSVYVADRTNWLMVKYAEDGYYITKWHFGDGIYQDSLGGGLCGITVDSKGSVWVIHWGGELYNYSSNGRLIKTYGYGGYHPTASGLQFREPWGIAVGKDGRIYTTHRNGQVQRFSPGAKAVLNWGGGKGIWRGGFDPAGISVTRDGHLLIANRSRSIEEYTTTGRLVARWDRARDRWSGGHYPVDVKADEAGNAYVAAWDHSELFIEKYTSDGELLFKWKPGIGLRNGGPVSIAVGTGFVYIADERNHKVLKFTYAGRQVPDWGR